MGQTTMSGSLLLFTLIPVAAALLAAIVAVNLKPGPLLVSAIQHFAAGVVFAAAASEILPTLIHSGSLAATLLGGAAGVGLMLAVKHFEARISGPVAFLAIVGIDIAVDGLVLGIAFAAGERTGVLLAVALSIELLFLGLTVATGLSETATSKLRAVGLTALLLLLLPVGAAVAIPVASLPPGVVTGFLAFGLMALLYLVTEELLVEAHEVPDKPWTAAMFFVGFLLLVAIEETVNLADIVDPLTTHGVPVDEDLPPPWEYI